MSCLNASSTFPAVARPCSFRQVPFISITGRSRMRELRQVTRAFKVEIRQDSGVTVLEVPVGSTILEAALDQGVDLPHDCKMGVCMTCPAKLVEGVVDQSAGMLSEDVREKGYALMCVAIPQSDCAIAVIEEDELLDEVMVR